MITVKVIEGDVAKIRTDALITAVNSEGIWYGAIDRVIMADNGSLFHEQALNALPLRHGQTVIARGEGRHRSAFRNVVFVIDDCKGPLSTVVFKALRAAADAEFRSVTLPTMRMGLMAGKVEKTPDEALRELALGIRRFRGKHRDTTLAIIKIVVFNDPSTAEKLRAMFADH